MLRLITLTILLLLVATPLQAQDTDTSRDPWSLARRLLKFDAEYAIPPPTPLYEPGAMTEFWVSKADQDEPALISASLAARTDLIYLWVEEGLFYSPNAMLEVADQLDQALVLMRLRYNYGDPTWIPELGPVPDFNSLLAIPDVDNDPHLFVLYARDLGEDQVIYNYHDELPAEIAPGGFSNQHELITVNTSALPDTPLNDGTFTILLAEHIYEMVVNASNAEQDLWLKEANSARFTKLLFPDIRPNATSVFLLDPNTSLNRPATTAPNNMATHGAQQLFLTYLEQRYGVAVVQSLMLQPGMGLDALDNALTENAVLDPVSGANVTAHDVFADFVIANVGSPAIPTLFGDGRFTYAAETLPENELPNGLAVANLFGTRVDAETVNQFGTRYFYVANGNAANFTLRFDGEAQSELLPLPDDSEPDNLFYWSGRDQNQNTTLTRSFDLREVDEATLQFDLWYDLDTARNYGYVEVSTDGGESWSILPTTLSNKTNRYGLAYGPGFTGKSNPEEPPPAPVLGIMFNQSDMSVIELVEDGPASRSELQPGDIVIGYDEQEWAGPPDIFGVLEDYAPGDTLNLYVQRLSERLSIPVILGAHETRVIDPAPIWVPQEVDLSDFVGQEIQIRFEYVSQPNATDSGMVIDNIAIPEIDYLDNAEGTSDWTLFGWQQTSNQVEQNFLVQYLSTGHESRLPRVKRLIGPEDNTVEGEWQFEIAPTEGLVLAISGLNDNTVQPAQFSLIFSEG